jgi:DNA-binding FadR family transcriptional regulator
MVGGLSDQEVMLMPVPSLMDRLESIRRVDARRRRDAFCAAVAAARGQEEDAQRLFRALDEQAGTAPRRRGFAELQQFLGE